MPNINDYDQLYRRRIKEAVGSDDPHYIKLEAVRPGKIRVLTHVTVENETTAFTKVRLGVDNGGVLHYLDELSSPAADELCIARNDIPLGEGDVLFAELTGVTASDVVVMTCIGWEKAA